MIIVSLLKSDRTFELQSGVESVGGWVKLLRPSAWEHTDTRRTDGQTAGPHAAAGLSPTQT